MPENAELPVHDAEYVCSNASDRHWACDAVVGLANDPSLNSVQAPAPPEFLSTIVPAVPPLIQNDPQRFPVLPGVPLGSVSEPEAADPTTVSVCTIAFSAVSEESYPVQHTGMMMPPVCEPVTPSEMVVADGDAPTFTTCIVEVWFDAVPNSETFLSIVPVVEPVTV